MLVFAIVFAATYALAIPVYAALRRSRRAGRVVFALLQPILLLLPLAIDSQHPFLRFCSALFVALVWFKSYDLLLDVTPIPGLGRFLTYLANPSALVLRRLDREPVPSRAENLRTLRSGLMQGAIGAALLSAAAHVAPAPDSLAGFVANHSLRVVPFFIAVIGLLQASVAILRLVAFEHVRMNMENDVFFAPTPAELWRRYNRMVGQAFHENVFMRAGGLRRPIRATLVVFLASAVLHEYVFGVAIGAVQGYQTAFFALHGIAVAATFRARPRGRLVPIGVAATVAFNLTTSMLFFASLDQIVPFWTFRWW